jgi:uncharacterized protein (DUF1778 family)
MIGLRTTAEEVQLIDDAADRVGLNRAAFIRSVAVQAARDRLPESAKDE